MRGGKRHGGGAGAQQGEGAGDDGGDDLYSDDGEMDMDDPFFAEAMAEHPPGWVPLSHAADAAALRLAVRLPLSHCPHSQA